MKKLIFIYILIFVTGCICTACVKGKSTAHRVETVSTDITEHQTTKAQESIPEPPSETEPVYELNTVEALEDDGKEMTAAEALRSTMKGKHSALELTTDKRMFCLFGLGWSYQYAEEVKDMSDMGLTRINMSTYNRGIMMSIMPVEKAKWDRFICVDLDQDGTKEVLAEGMGGGVVLYYGGKEVYMTVITSQCFPYEIYENGICLDGAGGAFSTGYNRLYPAKGAMYIERIAYMDVRENYILDIPPYKIMDKGVTKEECEAYIEELVGGLTPLEWHDFTEENIDRYVVD